MKKLFSIISFVLLFLTTFSQIGVQSTLCKNLTNPIGLDVLQPRFTWILASDKKNTTQSAYEVSVSTSLASLEKGTSWNTGKVAPDQSVYVVYSGVPLESGKKYFWQARVWDESGKVSPWSAVSL